MNNISTNLLDLYPETTPYQQHYLDVESPHSLYLEECGNPKGIPILYVHGGPGSGCNEKGRRFFDPKKYRIILFDQRGAGRCKPAAELIKNDTQRLVADIEAIRNYLKIDRWILFGGSWGSTLSLVYAETYPERVMSLILWGIFLARPQDLEWLYSDKGLKRIFPDYWQDFIAPLPNDQHHLPIPMYLDLLTHPDKNIRLNAAKAWAQWEARCLSMQPNSEILQNAVEAEFALNIARIEAHYFLNNAFLEPNQILRNIHKIHNIPATIIHGRFDMICLAENAWELHRAWPISELEIIPNAGHSRSEPGICDALIRATNKIWKRLA